MPAWEVRRPGRWVLASVPTSASDKTSQNRGWLKTLLPTSQGVCENQRTGCTRAVTIHLSRDLVLQSSDCETGSTLGFNTRRANMRVSPGLSRGTEYFLDHRPSLDPMQGLLLKLGGKSWHELNQSLGQTKNLRVAEVNY